MQDFKFLINNKPLKTFDDESKTKSYFNIKIIKIKTSNNRIFQNSFRPTKTFSLIKDINDEENLKNLIRIRKQAEQIFPLLRHFLSLKIST